ncbi:hypothetical protein H8B09_10295 [Paenibacillus sp. PR3]|uniref:Uncharacterized protein n=1 Tax=Paenibacillus terricola TaxID=2763503 RepID=A0ABR8MT53_9BACL|nr:hypothetical protein [Paenibacillus terricola]MBD3919145.1 hypothetical protein [Paenibacillus terricola]
MPLSIVWIIIIAGIVIGIQRGMLFNKPNANKGSTGEKIAFYTLLVLGVGLNIALFKDWLMVSPLNVLRMMFGPAAEAIAQWGMVGK